MKIRTTIGEVQLQESIYTPVLDALAQGAQTGRKLAALTAIQENGGVQRLLQLLIVMVGAGYVQPCVSASLEAAARATAQRFNDVVLSRNANGVSSDFPYLASPVVGSGLAIPRLYQLFVWALRAKPKGTAREHAESVWTVMRNSGQGLVKDGKPIDGTEASIAEIAERLAEWRVAQYPIARGLGLLQ